LLPAWEILVRSTPRTAQCRLHCRGHAARATTKFGPWKAKFDGLLSEGTLGGRKTYLLKPQTYMNLSGDSIGPALRFFKLPLEALVVHP